MMVNVQLSSDEALVLFELLAEPFKSNYLELLAQARSSVVEKYGE